MKRSHRIWHRWVWIGLAPILLIIFWFAFLNRPEVLLNEALPQILIEGEN